MFLEQFKITGLAMAQIFLLGGLGYLLVKKNILSHEGLDALSRLVIQIIFPALIFAQMLKNFRFNLYPDWWIFPLISLAITVTGLSVGWLLLKLSGLKTHKLQFLSLVAFQNSGYLPLAMAAAIFTGQQANDIFIFIFLFLLGFDLVAWSLGIYLLTYEKQVKFKLRSVFSPPVIANLTSLVLIALGLNKFIPDVLFKPLSMVGNCTLPLAMLVVGGNVALVQLKNIDRKTTFIFLLGKLIILPILGIVIVLKLALPHLLGFLIVMQLAMPSATSLSVIIRRFNKQDALISQGVFFSHIIGLLTIPLFLSLYLFLVMLK
ncbi:MAG: AEC family transporter [Candidatus Omnitrophica bacterium]|nr:AEC family transporter [Candidatus Omnitrophota bacterium]MBU4303075.1 AEC family transporter [Candidatus Omnitrophota bacterium]MBU4418366.1 AEC family transporter [Candidatus Omnitrophota bacterium]MBU4467743.1 AEC family transporter [Candidatus Omnitrophota bacterium]MCG2707500.1 AEC family transporter [Candidatus Omnitrophota bacterium]